MSHLGVPIGRSYQSKAGTTNANGIRADRLVRATPPIYECSCIECGTVFPVSHVRFDNASCANHMAHGRENRSRSQITQTISPDTATRSRDSQAFRQYEQEQRAVRYTFAGEPDFSKMEPEQVASYLSNVEGR